MCDALLRSEIATERAVVRQPAHALELGRVVEKLLAIAALEVLHAVIGAAATQPKRVERRTAELLARDEGALDQRVVAHEPLVEQLIVLGEDQEVERSRRLVCVQEVGGGPHA